MKTLRFAVIVTRLLSFVCTLAAIAVIQPAARGAEVVLHNFSAALPKGASPSGGLLRDAAGNLFGTTYSGGASGAGTIFKLHTSGRETVLYNFTGGLDGAKPNGGLISDPNGNLYGTTSTGGAFNAGVVFELDAAGKQSVLHAFTGGADGGSPDYGVSRDAQGNLYGTAKGGAANVGAVFKVDPAGNETVVYSFHGGQGNSDGVNPTGGVILDTAGNLYGTTTGGGVVNQGTVFIVDPAGQETVLFSFPEAELSRGYAPDTGLFRDGQGNLYGTTQFGSFTVNGGVLYEVGPSGGETVLYGFGLGNGGVQPTSGVIRDAQGYVYGTVSGGALGYGLVYKVQSNTPDQETVLYNFTNGADGANPYGDLVLDSVGNLYGTALGGVGNEGVIFEVNTSGQESVLYSFPGSSDGATPTAGVTRDSAGDLYGTTTAGGTTQNGTVYKVNSSGKETVVYSFPGGASGSAPQAGVIVDEAGNLYGTTVTGGDGPGCPHCITYGVVFKLDPQGQETVLYKFTGGSDGYQPSSGVIRDGAGNLHGTTREGGASGYGVLYEVNTTDRETVLYSFAGKADGAYPSGTLIRDAAGTHYGTTQGGGGAFQGVVYKVDSTGHETVLYSFTGGADGGVPMSGVIRDGAGNLYGTTSAGGAFGFGVVYKVDATGKESVLYSFTGVADGATPVAGLIRDKAGNLFGTTQAGGTDGKGVVFKVNSLGQETVLYSFTGPDGAYPAAGLTFGASGSLFGTTAQGGVQPDGVLFEIEGAVPAAELP